MTICYSCHKAQEGVRQKKSLFLIRRASGGGHRVMAEALAGDKYPLFSTEDFFVKDGKYAYDFSKVEEANEWCLSKVEEAMLKGDEKIFVANPWLLSMTNRKWEGTQPYHRLAEKYDYMVFSLLVEESVWE